MPVACRAYAGVMPCGAGLRRASKPGPAIVVKTLAEKLKYQRCALPPRGVTPPRTGKVTEKKQVQRSAAQTTTAETNGSQRRITFEELSKRIEQKRKEAIEAKKWKNLTYVNIGGYKLTVVFSPAGRASLRIVSPRLRNRFIIANVDAARAIVEIGKYIEANWELINSTLSIIGARKRTEIDEEYL